MINRNTGKPYTLTLEDLILTAWCVFEDLVPTNCKLILKPQKIDSYVYCSTTTRNHLITSLVNVFCKMGSSEKTEMVVAIEDYSLESVKISVCNQRHIYSFRELLTQNSTPS